MSLKDIDLTMRMRDVIVSICENTIKRLRPEPRIGMVQDYNRILGTVDVLLPGDTEPITARMYQQLQPSKRAYDQVNESNEPVAQGDIVRIIGKLGNYWITEVITGNPVIIKPQLSNPLFSGGVNYSEKHMQFWAGISALPIVDNTYSLGRWTRNDGGLDYSCFFEIQTRQTLNNSQFKNYRVCLINNIDEDSVWLNLIPFEESGNSVGNDYDLEIFHSSNYFELRVRRKLQGVNPDPSGVEISMFIWGAEFEFSTLEAIENSDPVPTLTLGTTRFGKWSDEDGESDKGPFFDSRKHLAQVRANHTLMDGGVVIWDGTNLSWEQPFRAQVGMSDFSNLNGYIEITSPTVGSIVTHHGMPNWYEQTVASTGINMAYGGATESSLYYRPKMVSGGATDNTRFALVGSETPFDVPSHWIHIATFDSRNTHYSLRLGTGQLVDHWKTISLAASIAAFSSTNVPRWRFAEGNIVELTGGFARSAGSFANNDQLGTLPTQAKPTISTQRLSARGGLSSGATFLDVEVNTGVLFLRCETPASLTSIFMDGLRFYLR